MKHLLMALLCFCLLAFTGCQTAQKPQFATLKELVVKARSDYAKAEKEAKSGALTKKQAARATAAWTEFTKAITPNGNKDGAALSKIAGNPPDKKALDAYHVLDRKLASFYVPPHPHHRGDL